jgi:hypothetical protein
LELYRLERSFYDLDSDILAGFSNNRLAALLGFKPVRTATNNESCAGGVRSGDSAGAGIFIVAALACGNTLKSFHDFQYPIIQRIAAHSAAKSITAKTSNFQKAVTGQSGRTSFFMACL